MMMVTDGGGYDDGLSIVKYLIISLWVALTNKILQAPALPD